MKAKNEARVFGRLLTDPDPDLAVAAADALGEMEAQQAIPELELLLSITKTQPSDIDSVVPVGYGDRERSMANALARILKAGGNTPGLEALLKNSNGFVRMAAIDALGNLQGMEVSTEITTRFNKAVGEERGSSIRALGRMQARNQIPEFVKLLTDTNYSEAAADALGELDANETVPEIVKLLEDKDSSVRRAAAYALGRLQAKETAPEVAKLLKDQEYPVRYEAAKALGRMRAKEMAPEIVKLINDPDGYVHEGASYSLEFMGPLPNTIVSALASLFYSNQARQDESRFLCYYLTGGDPAVSLLLRRSLLEENQEPVILANSAESREEIRAIHDLIDVTRSPQRFALDTDRQILDIVRKWKGRTPGDDAFLYRLSYDMNPDSAQLLRELIPVAWWQPLLENAWKFIALQAALWALLIYFYPRYSWVQALFFWNRWIRKVFGLAYVDFCLTFIPFLRDRLLSPFREELVADARVQDKALGDYFPDVEVEERGQSVRLRIDNAIPVVRGQIVLEGESGLGKSTFLRLLVRSYPKPIVYLPASSCEHGVFNAIQLKLKGKASDERFLNSIIWSGGLSVVVDGLNEVSVETRETIQAFLKEFPNAHVILASQPLLWKRPPRARVFSICPLQEQKILRFLESRFGSFKSPTKNEDEYKILCRKYLADVLSPLQAEEDRSNALFVLSNPMDLTTASLILASGDRPTLNNLQEQQFKQMALDYKSHHAGEDVPLANFSESIYMAMLQDASALPAADFFALIQEMVAHKMALEQHDINVENKPITKWVFRHDKIRDYFLVHAFLKSQERIPEHMDDARFRGVYLMLASLLPLDQAAELKDSLVDRAAETMDHYLSDSVVQILKARRSKAHGSKDRQDVSQLS